MLFNIPEVRAFFDNRLIISWVIIQPEKLPSLEKILFKISADPELIFEPNQSSIIEIPSLENNKIIVNWVVAKPNEETEISLTLSCPIIEETQKIVFNP